MILKLKKKLMPRLAARKHGLDRKLVCAIIEQESGWNNWANRYEPGFYRRYIAPMLASRRRGVKSKGKLNLVVPRHVSADTEANGRATSWGLMQVMGQTARENGFKGRFFSEMCAPEVGLDVGCRVLRRYLDSKGGDLRAGLLKWNGGGNKKYPDEVLARRHKY